MPNSEDSIRIENVVASATLNQRFDLNAVVKGNPGVDIARNIFQASFQVKKT
jgi:TATA-box binding protein (TBP) (component of TFIID and TFIIIB)